MIYRVDEKYPKDSSEGMAWVSNGESSQLELLDQVALNDNCPQKMIRVICLRAGTRQVLASFASVKFGKKSLRRVEDFEILCARLR